MKKTAAKAAVFLLFLTGRDGNRRIDVAVMVAALRVIGHIVFVKNLAAVIRYIHYGIDKLSGIRLRVE